MSTATGMAAASATSANVSSPAAATQGSGLWQLPHRGVPRAAAGTRFIRPQFAHLTSSAGVLPCPSGMRRSYPGFS
jgi:hypothetical protein